MPIQKIHSGKHQLNTLLLLLFTLPTIYQSCADFGTNGIDTAQEIFVRGNYFTIEWDNPFYVEESNKIKSYKIYIRKHGTYGWTLLSEEDYSERKAFTIEKGDLNSGQYDLGISIVTVDGDVTAIHSSLDITAIPQTGWYIFWIMD